MILVIRSYGVYLWWYCFILRGGGLGQFSEQSFEQDFNLSFQCCSSHKLVFQCWYALCFAQFSCWRDGALSVQLWEHLTGQFLNPLVDSTHLLQFLGQPSFPFLCLRRNAWLRGHLWRNCENAVLSTWDGKAWENCNNFIGEEDIKKYFPSQEWRENHIKLELSLNKKLSLIPSNLNGGFVSWTDFLSAEPDQTAQLQPYVNGLRHHLRLQISDQDKNARSVVLRFDFIFAGLHANTVSLTSSERCLFCIFLWIN